MIALLPILGELGSIEKVVITALAVAGGFLVGFVLTHFVARLLSKFVWKKEPPENLIRFARFAGGVATALLVYLLLTGDGGFGLGGRGGGATASLSDGVSDTPNAPKQDVPKQDAKKDESKTKDKTDETGGQVLYVHLRRFDAPEQRFFQFGDETKPLTLEEVLQRIEDVRKSDPRPITVVKIRAGVPEYSVQAATLLNLKLSQRGIDSTLPTLKEPAVKN